MNSKFNGGLLGYIGTGLLMFVIIVFSLGLATPWAICIGARWYARHSTIDGRQVVFDGTGWQLFGNCVKWFFLSIITLFEELLQKPRHEDESYKKRCKD